MYTIDVEMSFNIQIVATKSKFAIHCTHKFIIHMAYFKKRKFIDHDKHQLPCYHGDKSGSHKK